MMKSAHLTKLFASALILLAGCNFSTENATPTLEVTIEQPVNPLPEITEIPASSATLAPSAQPANTGVVTAVVQIYTPQPSSTPFPTGTLLPTETPGHWEYTIQPGDSLGYIIQLPPFNYDNFDVIREIVRINDNIPNADSLPPVGSVILIPRPTSTPTPSGDQATSIFDETRRTDLRRFPANTQFGCHTVESGWTLVGIAELYGITLEILSQLNPDIDFRGCNFENPGGGPNCNPIIYEGQCVNVPFPTPTPTLTATPSGHETATPTPTFQAPSLIFPPDGSIVPPGILTLRWVSAGILQPDEYYLVQVTDTTAVSQPWLNVTRNTSIILPENLIPADSQTHNFEWNIVVARINEQGLYAPVGETSPTRAFQWQSR